MPSSRLSTVVLFLCAAVWSCSNSPTSGDTDDPDASPDSSAGSDAGVRDASNESDATAAGCERFDFVASGVECPATGCPSVVCHCPEGFTISHSSCSPDGCLTSADCDTWCAEDDFRDGFDCNDTYRVASTPPDGGAGQDDGGAEQDDSGTVSPPECDPAVVDVEPTAIDAMPEDANAQRLIVDGDGNRILAGEVAPSSTINFSENDDDALAEGPNLFLVKLDPEGAHVWSRRLGSEAGINSIDVLRFASNGDILVGGKTGRSPDFGGEGEPQPEGELSQIYAARYEPSGDLVRSYLLPGSGTTLSAVVERSNGALDLWGDFSREIEDADGNPIGSQGDKDIFRARFSDEGELPGVVTFGGSRNDVVGDVVAEANDHTYLVGFSFHQVDFGGDVIDLGDSSSSYVVKLDGNGVPVWQKVVHGSGIHPRRILLDGEELVVAGDSYAVGAYYGSEENPVGEGNLFVLRIDSGTGELVQAHAYDTEGSAARVLAMALGADGGPLIGGSIRTPADFGGGLTGQGVQVDPFVARYRANGDHLWSTAWCAVEHANVTGVAFDGTVPLAQVAYSSDLTLGSTELSTGESVTLDLPAED